MRGLPRDPSPSRPAPLRGSPLDPCTHRRIQPGAGVAGRVHRSAGDRRRRIRGGRDDPRAGSSRRSRRAAGGGAFPPRRCGAVPADAGPPVDRPARGRRGAGIGLAGAAGRDGGRGGSGSIRSDWIGTDPEAAARSLERVLLARLQAVPPPEPLVAHAVGLLLRSDSPEHRPAGAPHRLEPAAPDPRLPRAGRDRPQGPGQGGAPAKGRCRRPAPRRPRHARRRRRPVRLLRRGAHGPGLPPAGRTDPRRGPDRPRFHSSNPVALRRCKLGP